MLLREMGTCGSKCIVMPVSVANLRVVALVVLSACAGSRSTISPPRRSAEDGAARPSRRVEPVAAAPAFADPNRRSKLESAIPEIDAHLQRTVERDGLVGLAAGLVIDDELVWSRGYGLRDLERGLPVESDTAFGIGSITKPITGLAALLLRDRGALSLDQPAVDALPALQGLIYPTEDSPLVTVRHLMMHTSGLPRMGNFPEYPSVPQTRAEFLASLDGLPLERAPGVERVYSNLGFQILGQLVGEVAGEDHRTFIRREILEPMGMHGSRWTPQEVGEHQLALPYELDDTGRPRRREHWTPGAADAAGGLYASVEDLARFAIFNLSAWPAGGTRERGPLSRATIREAHTIAQLRSFVARSSPAGEPAVARVVGAGLGFSAYSTCHYEHVVAHAGKTMGHRASLHMLPRHGVAVILLSNLSSIHSSVLPRDGEAVLERLHDTGALLPRRPNAAPGLLEGAETLASLVSRWSAQGYARTFSPDFRDAFREEATRAQLEEWRDLVGSCRSAQVIEATDVYAGRIGLTCDHAHLEVVLRVAPWDGHPLTSMQVLGATGIDPDPELLDSARSVTGLLDAWKPERFERIFSPSSSATQTEDLMSAVHEAVGHCEVGELRFVEPDGATFVLPCARGRATLRLGLDDAGKIERLEFHDDLSGSCR